MPEIIKLTPQAWVHRGHINVGIIPDGDRVSLIDCCDDVQESAARAAMVLFTHYHRDQACGIYALAAAGATIAVPGQEATLFSEVDAWWRDPGNQWRDYSADGHRLLVPQPAKVGRLVADGDAFECGETRISAVATPGHTAGSMSYLVESDHLRVVFCGDLIYCGGRILDLYSLQREGVTDGYHGFMGARGDLIASLRRVEVLRPDILVPSHGDLISDPRGQIERLIARLECYWNLYAETSAMHWYHPEVFLNGEHASEAMPSAEVVPPPGWLRRVGTSWILTSETGAAFVLDCGSEDVSQALRSWQESGELSEVEGLWITHYHDDHVDAISAFREQFACPVIAVEPVSRVVSRPSAWWLPCLSPAVVAVDKVPEDGESWRWREFTLTAYDFPGQTLYHGALLVEGRGSRLLFAGDSFTPSGMDDYCPRNRNFLGAGAGFDRCLQLIEQLRPEALLNSHVEVAFSFSSEQVAWMRENLAERGRLLRTLTPWDDPNFALDERWVRCDPYQSEVQAGETARVSVVITNHAPDDQEVCCRPVLPGTWRGSEAPEARATAPAKACVRIPIGITAPAGAAPGRYAVPVDIHFGGRMLRQFSEAVVVLR